VLLTGTSQAPVFGDILISPYQDISLERLLNAPPVSLSVRHSKNSYLKAVLIREAKQDDSISLSSKDRSAVNE